MRLMTRESRVRLSLAIIGSATILLLTAYALVHQSTRLAANDLPLATAQIIKHQLEAGAAPQDVIPQTKTDSLRDNTVFAIVTDSQPKVLASSLVDEQSAIPPKGVFDYTAKNGSDHITWQTGAGARLATQVITYKTETSSGYIVAGQPLTQAEQRIATYGLLILVAWLVILAWTFLTIWFYL